MVKPLYLQYRSTSFDDLVGQSHIGTILRHQVATNQVFHTYVFYGPRGVGKTSTARVLAKAANCLRQTDGNPCGECINCEIIQSGGSADLTEIDAASHTGVDNIREVIIDKVSYPPTQLNKKVYIIDEVHMLSKSAFNALLKVMEEPPEYVLFVLATTEVQKIPETILSRAQLFQFRRLTNQDIVGRLEHIANQENITTEPAALEAIARLAEGGLRDAIKYLDHARIAGEVTIENVSTVLGVVPHERIDRFIQMLTAKEQWDDILKMLDQFHTEAVDRNRLTQDMLHELDTLFSQDPAQYHDILSLMFRISDEISGSHLPHLIYKSHCYQYIRDHTAHMTTDRQAIQDTTGNDTEQSASKANISSDEQSEQKKENDDNIDTNDQKTNEQSGSYPSGQDILQYLRENADGKTTQSALIKSTTFYERDGARYTFVVINLFHYKNLIKEDVRNSLENTVRTQFGGQIVLHFVHKTKEEFFDE